nr:hypothetical protein [Vibrio aestuarianus]
MVFVFKAVCGCIGIALLTP